MQIFSKGNPPYVLTRREWFKVSGESLRCELCRERVTSVVVVGEVEDWESRTTRLCLKCIEEAARLLRQSLDGATET